MTDLTADLDRALTFAGVTHAAQRRRGTGVPYFAHPLGVCSLVLEEGGSETEAIAALLHDAVEDAEDATPGALRVSLADKLHNARSIVFDVRTHGDVVWTRFNRDSDQPWCYEQLVKAFRSRGAGPMVDELERTVVELRRLANRGQSR